MKAYSQGISAPLALTGLPPHQRSLREERKSKRNLFPLACWAFSTSEVGLFQEVISKNNRGGGQEANTERKVNLKSTARAGAASAPLTIWVKDVSSNIGPLRESLGESVSKPALSKALPQLFCASFVQSPPRQGWPPESFLVVCGLTLLPGFFEFSNCILFLPIYLVIKLNNQ